VLFADKLLYGRQKCANSPGIVFTCGKDKQPDAEVAQKEAQPCADQHTLPLSYRFSHLGANVFVATCRTPTYLEFSTRVFPHSSGKVDKRAITVLLFRAVRVANLLFFLRTWQEPTFFFSLSLSFHSQFGDKWPTTRKRPTRAIGLYHFLLTRGCKLSSYKREMRLNIPTGHICVDIQIGVTCSG